MKILITGISGYVGSSLVRSLKAEHTIYGLDSVVSRYDGVERVFTLSEIADIPPVDVVIHLAGKSVETHDLSHAFEYFKSNAGFTRAVFGSFVRSSAKTFIFFSSVKAAADKVDKKALTEDMEPNPFGSLGESKLLAEKYILNQYVVDKNVYVLRPTIVHGNGDLGNKNMRILYRWVKNGYPFPFGKFECKRSFTTMDNLCFVMKKLVSADIPSGIYNVADDGYLSVREVYEIMCSVLNKKPRILNVNKSLIRFVADICTFFKGFFDDYRYQKLCTNFVVSNEKIKIALGIDKMPVSAVDGLSKSISEFKI